jgi:hypothetical protein
MGSVTYPSRYTFADADFVYCDSIAVCVCAIEDTGGAAIDAWGLNVIDPAWSGAPVFTSGTADIHSISVATDYDNYPGIPYVYLAAHIDDKIHFWTSTDKGASWTRHAVIDSGDVSFPDIAYGWDSGGDIYITYYKDIRVCVAKNTNFGNPSFWTTMWATWPIYHPGSMSVIAAVGDTVHVLFEREHTVTASTDVTFRSSVDAGSTWAGYLGSSYPGTEIYPDITGRGGKFRIAYLHWEGSDRYVEHRECLNSAAYWWAPADVINDHFPYWDVKPFGNPCVENLPGGNAAVMYTGFDENRRVWIDYVNNPVAVEETPLTTSGFTLMPIRNPASGTTRIAFSVPAQIHIDVDIFDVRGRKVETLLAKTLGPGEHALDWDSQNVPAGMYFVRLHSNKQSVTRKLVVLH